MKIQKKCLYCDNEFETENRYINRGHGKFCSIKCSSIYRNKYRPTVVPNTNCAYCKNDFYMPPKRLQGSKSGLYFCCRNHKDQAQRIGGVKEIMPSHYGTKLNIYRDIAAKELDMSKCSQCFYDKHPEILEVNHIDCDHKNNDVLNLQVLCPNCHREYHFLTQTGFWRKKESYLALPPRLERRMSG